MTTTKEMLHKISEIADHYGRKNQMPMLQEECAELIQAVSKLARAGDWEETSSLHQKLQYLNARYSVAEEMADVWIMLLQAEHLLGNREMVEIYAQQKLDRTIGKMQKEAL